VENNDYCAACGNVIGKGDPHLEIRGQMIDGMRMPWPVCKKCWMEHYNGYPKLSAKESDRIFNEIQKRLHENCDGAPDGGHTKECKEVTGG
jgi:hypothetical protein